MRALLRQSVLRAVLEVRSSVGPYGLRANEITRGTTTFSDNQGKTGFYECRTFTEVVAIQTHSCF
jgi:hypothetical protein